MLEKLLASYDDIRINKNMLNKLDRKLIQSIAPKYNKRNPDYLLRYHAKHHAKETVLGRRSLMKTIRRLIPLPRLNSMLRLCALSAREIAALPNAAPARHKTKTTALFNIPGLAPGTFCPISPVFDGWIALTIRSISFFAHQHNFLLINTLYLIHFAILLRLADTIYIWMQIFVFHLQAKYI